MERKSVKGSFEYEQQWSYGRKLNEWLITVGEKTKRGISLIFFQWGLLLAVVGFLLGRAMILAELTPFILPFVAVVFQLRREKVGIAILAVLAGTLSHTLGNGWFVLLAVPIYFLFFKIVGMYVEQRSRTLPIAVFCASVSARVILIYIQAGTVTNYEWMMAGVEAGLSFVLTMIFLQSIPLITTKRSQQTLKHEEIVCLIILLASVMTGTVGWVFYEMTAEHILARYLVLLFSFVAGAAIGSTVGVVTGLILSLASVANLYQMSLLAFSGLLGGLLKDGRKAGVSAGLLVGTLLIGLYGEGADKISITFIETMVAIGLFMMTPKSWIEELAKFIPGTTEHSKEQQQYLRKVRDVTAGRVEQFSSLFQTLSNSFQATVTIDDEGDLETETDYLLSEVTAKTCQACFKKEKCWGSDNHVNKTYETMAKVMQEIQLKGKLEDERLRHEWKKTCTPNHEKLIEVMKKELEIFQSHKKIRKQLQESRKLVAEQLRGVSQVMGDFAREIQVEKEAHYIEEEQLLDALRQAGLEIGHVDIFRLEERNIEVEMSVADDGGHGQCEKIIAPILSDIFGETIIVKQELSTYYPNGYKHVSFSSAKKFELDIGIAHVAKGGGWISGDSYSTIELSSGKYAIAISDGMGNGERAHIESNETLQLLQKILQSGIEELIAIKSINSVLSLRSTEEMFSTLDLAMIDLQDAKAKFLKVGSIPSFIKRGKKVIKVEASNLPMGMIQEFDVEVVTEQMKSGDLLIMMSDGVIEAPQHVENRDIWMKRIISELTTNDPQEVADVILERAIRSGDESISDDMTIIVTKVKRSIPKWAAFPIYHQTDLYKKKA